eukprot:scaffold4847_cov403-Prasinococcus_capsulatus_cf.AAC.2
MARRAPTPQRAGGLLRRSPYRCVRVEVDPQLAVDLAGLVALQDGLELLDPGLHLGPARLEVDDLLVAHCGRSVPVRAGPGPRHAEGRLARAGLASHWWSRLGGGREQPASGARCGRDGGGHRVRQRGAQKESAARLNPPAGPAADATQRNATHTRTPIS